jgi:hypothetical protein
VNTDDAKRAAKTAGRATANTVGSNTNANLAERAGVRMEGEARSARTVGPVSAETNCAEINESGFELMGIPFFFAPQLGYCVHNRQKNNCYECNTAKRKVDFPVATKKKGTSAVFQLQPKEAKRHRALDKTPAFIATSNDSLEATQFTNLTNPALDTREGKHDNNEERSLLQVDFHEVSEDEDVIVVD